MPIYIRDISVQYGDFTDGPIIRGLTCNLRDRELTLIVGKSGSGKSTLLQALSGLRRPSQGEISYDDEPLWVRDRPTPALFRANLVHQLPEEQLFARTVRGEFEYSLKPHRLAASVRGDRMTASLAALNLETVRPASSPFTLSGGTKRKLAVALSAATEPEWLFLDEPSAGIDAPTLKRLLEYIQSVKATSRSVVIATHDLDAFLPVADRVLVLANGRLLADMKPLELACRTDVLVEADLGVPAAFRLIRGFAAQGLELRPHALTPDALAESIADRLQQPQSASGRSQSAVPEPASRLALTSNPEPSPVSRTEHNAPAVQNHTWSRILDPRSKWAIMLLYTIGTMVQTGWTGVGLAAGWFAIAALSCTRPQLQFLARAAAAFSVFAAVSVGLSGIGWDHAEAFPLTFSLEKAEQTGFNMAKLFLLTGSGWWFTATTSTLRIKQGLEQSLSAPLFRKLPIEIFSLAVSLLLRFIPLIGRELARFSMIVRSRGKAAVKPGTIRPRDIPALVVPVLLSLFHWTEQWTEIIRLKGIHRKRPLGDGPLPLRWSKIDTWAVAIGFIMLLTLLLL